MGGPDQLAKDVFAEEIPLQFGESVRWHQGLELNMVELRLDGVLIVADGASLISRPAPWPLAHEGFVVVEVKMPGDHLDWASLQRALFRRQALQTALAEREPPDERWVPLWLVAPHLPGWVRQRYAVSEAAPGCWVLESSSFQVLWVAANELPLDEALVPFLLARSGKALVTFLDWVVGRRPVEWLERVLQWVSMTPEQKRELQEKLRQRQPPPGFDDAARKRMGELVEALAERWAPEVLEAKWAKALQEGREVGLQEGREVGLQEGREAGLQAGLEAGVARGKVAEARHFVERVLAKRGLALSPEQRARLDDCAELATLERWLDQAIVASNVDEALR